MKRLNRASVAELRSIIATRRPDLIEITEQILDGRLGWTPQRANALRNIVGDEFLEHELDRVTYEPTRRGIELEGLIDAIARVGWGDGWEGPDADGPDPVDPVVIAIESGYRRPENSAAPIDDQG